MHIYGIVILYKARDEAKLLVTAENLSSFGYFQRSTVREFIQFFAITLCMRLAPGAHHSVEEEEYGGMCHVYTRYDNLSIVATTERNYPSRVIFSLMHDLLDQFSSRFPKNVWESCQSKTLSFPELETQLFKYEDPVNADKLLAIQKDLEETKVTLHKTIESVLERGEKLENIVERSNDLSVQSKVFYKTARKTNSCCTFM